MFGFAIEELAWALAREREEEVRQIRPHLSCPKDREPLRSRLARALVGLGVRLDPSAGELRGNAARGYR